MFGRTCTLPNLSATEHVLELYRKGTTDWQNNRQAQHTSAEATENHICLPNMSTTEPVLELDRKVCENLGWTLPNIRQPKQRKTKSVCRTCPLPNLSPSSTDKVLAIYDTDSLCTHVVRMQPYRVERLTQHVSRSNLITPMFAEHVHYRTCPLPNTRLCTLRWLLPKSLATCIRWNLIRTLCRTCLLPNVFTTEQVHHWALDVTNSRGVTN